MNSFTVAPSRRVKERLKGLRADPKTGYSTAAMRGKRPAPRMQAPLSVRRSGY